MMNWIAAMIQSLIPHHIEEASEAIAFHEISIIHERTAQAEEKIVLIASQAFENVVLIVSQAPAQSPPRI